MDTVGAFRMGANLDVRADDLNAHEEALIAARHGGRQAEPLTSRQPPQARLGGRSSRKVREPLPADWWRHPIGGGDGGSLAPANRME